MYQSRRVRLRIIEDRDVVSLIHTTITVSLAGLLSRILQGFQWFFGVGY